MRGGLFVSSLSFFFFCHCEYFTGANLPIQSLIAMIFAHLSKNPFILQHV